MNMFPAPVPPPPTRPAVADAIMAGRQLADRSWLRDIAWPLSRSQTVALTLILLTVIAAMFRCHRLGYAGFSEDEINKLNAIRAYAAGNLGANAEHPMLMKAMMWASTALATVWNGVGAGAGWPAVSPEAALRAPNALAGAGAVVLLFLLARTFFGTATGLWAAMFLAFDVIASGINRIGKEDSFLVLFLLLGAWLYEEARTRHLRSGVAPHRWYAASGAAFGLILASKYMPFYLGLWGLFGLAASAEARRAGCGRTDGAVKQNASKWFWLAMPAAFLIANPAILLPATWRYLVGYVTGGTITHHGAFFAGQLYVNTIGATPWGLPWHFYLTYLVTKIPLPVLAAITLGLVELVRRRRERGAVFARVFLLFFLLPASLAAGKFGRYLLPTLVVLDVVAALGVVRASDLVGQIPKPAPRALAAGALTVVIVGAPLMAQARWSADASLHQNGIGRLIATPGSLFPNDELYDIGMREAVDFVAQRAARGASIASDAPGVVREYLRRNGRLDLEARSLSMAGLARPPVETWLLAQNSHACFESIAVVEQVRRAQRPDFMFRVRGTVAVEAFRLPWSMPQGNK